MTLATRLVPLLAIATALMFAPAPFMIYGAPLESTMGVIQKIFYFHVPAATAAFMGAIVCGVASALFLWRRNRLADHFALSGAELAVLFGLIMLVTGPLWARKAWGIWWQWDVRLTTALVMWMVFVSYLLVRRFGGPGSEMMSAVVGVFGMALVPFVYISVNFWRTIHPTTNVVPSLPASMMWPFGWSMIAFTLLFTTLLLVRVRLETNRAMLEDAYVAMED
ncbi:MAG TPA: cytochrome c biogenesis protein CcsA [Vicinamibacterales bacterium]|nr:cytochrome c biogenesis protein CcsA [Vicinamibacterales bacterium]